MNLAKQIDGGQLLLWFADAMALVGLKEHVDHCIEGAITSGDRVEQR